jgi:hypothetical protein
MTTINHTALSFTAKYCIICTLLLVLLLYTKEITALIMNSIWVPYLFVVTVCWASIPDQHSTQLWTCSANSSWKANI